MRAIKTIQLILCTLFLVGSAGAVEGTCPGDRESLLPLMARLTIVAQWCDSFSTPTSGTSKESSIQVRNFIGKGTNGRAKIGESVTLGVEGADPDGDSLSYNWWVYQEPGNYKGALHIDGANPPETSFTVPQDARHGQTVHVICEVTDDGSPPLTRYTRSVIEFIKE